FASTGTLVTWGGGAFNRVSDHFALARADQTCAYEDVSPLGYEVPRERANRSVLYTLPTVIRRHLSSTCRSQDRFDNVARRLSAFLARRAERLFGLTLSKERRTLTRTYIARGLSRYGLERRRYERIFTLGRPRVVLATAGSQGSLAPAIQVAHALGIPVA